MECSLPNLDTVAVTGSARLLPLSCESFFKHRRD